MNQPGFHTVCLNNGGQAYKSGNNVETLSNCLGSQLDNGGQAYRSGDKTKLSGSTTHQWGGQAYGSGDKFLGLQFNNEVRPTCFGTRQKFLDVLGLQFRNNKYQYPDLLFSNKPSPCKLDISGHLEISVTQLLLCENSIHTHPPLSVASCQFKQYTSC